MEVRGSSVVVRLAHPYPDFSTLGGNSEVCLRLEGGDDSAWLEQIGADRINPAGNGAVLIEGQLKRLLAGTQALTANPGGAPAALALSQALESLRRPALALKIGGQVWEFGQRTYLLGVVNVTPDSFSGDGVGADPGAAVLRARHLVSEGADAIDIGGESTRPGHEEVSTDEEIRRVAPAIELLVAELSVPVFVDTSKAAVARAALSAGASGVNDVWGLRRDPEMAEVVAAARVPVICMHNQSGHQYSDLMGDVLDRLHESIELAGAAGIPPDQVVVDPGIGFGKTPSQNYEVLRRLVELRVLGCSILVGTSRKSLIGWLLDERPVDHRVLGTAATVAWSIACGADIVRVHDVAQIRDVSRVMDALVRHRPS